MNGAVPSIEQFHIRVRRVAWMRRVLTAAASAAAVSQITALIAAGVTGSSIVPASSMTSVQLLLMLTVFALVFALLWWRATPVRLDAIALWIEEQGRSRPDFSLVTWLEQGRPAEGALAAAAAARLHDADLSAGMRRLVRTTLGPPALFLLGVLLLGVLRSPILPRVDIERAPAAMVPAAGSPRAPTLQPWRVTVVPPRYAARSRTSLGDVASVRALVGSTVVIEGQLGDDETIRPAAELRVIGRNGTSPLAVDPVDRAARWAVRSLVRDTPSTVIVAHADARRLLVLEGIPDSLPRVALEAPARDSVFRQPVGVIPLRASVSDDIGLAAARFEVVITSGEGERFTVRTEAVGARSWSAAASMRRHGLDGTLDLSALGLQPGDVLHVRALARDHHPASDREFGSSETRAFRIARPAEYDSVAVEPAPPPAVDTSLLSQRMLLRLTERLDRQQPRMARAAVVRDSQRLARDQAKLRLAVGDVVFQRLSGESSAEHAHAPGDGHDHAVDLQDGKLTMRAGGAGVLDEGNDAPVIAINQPLLEAYNAMWDAGRALEQGDPHAAIPAMLRALEAIERSRAASRLYLRGRPPQVIVDIAKVRLTGRDTGQSAVRSARQPLSQPDGARDQRLVRLVTGDLSPAALRDSLAVLRVEALVDAPAFAGALASALDALADGRDLTPALMRARRALGLVTPVTPGLWTRGVPR